MSRRVLIADDSALVRRQVTAALIGAGYEVIETVDGADALQKLTPDLALVVCDLNMPRMNGLELLERLHADRALSVVPFVMLTTEARPKIVDQARSLGAKAWLIKPFKSDVFLAVVNKLVRNAR